MRAPQNWKLSPSGVLFLLGKYQSSYSKHSILRRDLSSREYVVGLRILPEHFEDSQFGFFCIELGKVFLQGFKETCQPAPVYRHHKANSCAFFLGSLVVGCCDKVLHGIIESSFFRCHFNGNILNRACGDLGCQFFERDSVPSAR